MLPVIHNENLSSLDNLICSLTYYTEFIDDLAV